MGRNAYRQLLPREDGALFVATELVRSLIGQKISLATSGPRPNGLRPEERAFIVGGGFGYRLRWAHYAPGRPPVVGPSDGLPCVFGLPSKTKFELREDNVADIDEILDHLDDLVNAEIRRDDILEGILEQDGHELAKDTGHEEYLVLGTVLVSRSLAMAEAMATRRREAAIAMKALDILDMTYEIQSTGGPPEPSGIFSQAEFELCFPELGGENPL